MFEKIENFDNVVEFLLLKALLQTLIVSNWKIYLIVGQLCEQHDSHKIKQLQHL